MPPIRALVLSISLFFPAQALADWSYREISRSGGATIRLAVTAEQYHGFGLRCDDGLLSVQYLTNDPMSPAQMAKINAGGVRLLVETGKTVAEVPGEMQRVADAAIFVGLVERELFSKLVRSGENIDLALRFGGALTHERSFETKGAAEPLGEIRRGCLD